MRLPGSTGLRGRGGRGIVSSLRSRKGRTRNPLAAFAVAQGVEEFAGGQRIRVVIQGPMQVIEGSGTVTTGEVHKGEVEGDDRWVGAQFPGSLQVGKRRGITLRAVVEHAA